MAEVPLLMRGLFLGKDIREIPTLGGYKCQIRDMEFRIRGANLEL